MTCTVQKLSRKLFWTLVAVGAQIPILGAQATLIQPAAQNGSTVWTGNGALNAAQISGIVGEPGLGSFYDVLFKVQLTTGASADSQVIFTSKQTGSALSVRIVNPGANDSPLSVSVSGGQITITLSTNAVGAVTSTAAQVAAAVNANPNTSAIVAASAGGTGTGLVQALSATPLAPVITETGPFAGSYGTAFANSASSPQDATVTYGGGAAIDASSLFLYVRDTGPAPAFYIYDLLAPAFSWNGLENLMLQGFWPNAGSIEQVSIVGIVAGPTPVPEGSSLALLALGIGMLAWSLGRARLRA